MTSDIKNRGGAVDLISLTKQYVTGEPCAVDSADLSIAAGDFVTLLGPSGSGKTTTLNMIAGFVSPTSGRIELDGVDLRPIPTHRRNFGMVFQNYSLFPHMTAWENIAFPLKERRLPKSEIVRLVRDVVRLVELEGLETRKPSQLSGGQQQRVALARAIVYSPRVLLLDEPLGALDRKLRQSLQNQIKRIHREVGTTFIFVTHDQEEAMFLSDRIAVFNEGRIERVGSPSDLYQDPGTLFVAEFLGESNVFHGSLAGSVYEWCDSRWSAEPRPDASGAPLLVVRPERLSLVADESHLPSGCNSVPAVVTNYAFLGTVRRVELDYGNGTQGCAVLPASEAFTARPGDKVVAYWDPDCQSLVSSSR